MYFMKAEMSVVSEAVPSALVIIKKTWRVDLRVAFLIE